MRIFFTVYRMLIHIKRRLGIIIISSARNRRVIFWVCAVVCFDDETFLPLDHTHKKKHTTSKPQARQRQHTQNIAHTISKQDVDCKRRAFRNTSTGI